MKTYEFTASQLVMKIIKVRAKNQEQAVKKLERRIMRTKNYKSHEGLCELYAEDCMYIGLLNEDEEDDAHWKDYLVCLT